MMKITKEQGMHFLNEMDAPITSKEQIFRALFEVCGIGENVNTKHIFFQDVIIKFNASKAKAVILGNLPYATESHYVDVAVYAYIKAGFNMRDFDSDLTEFKKRRGFIYTQATEFIPNFVNA